MRYLHIKHIHKVILLSFAFIVLSCYDDNDFESSEDFKPSTMYKISNYKNTYSDSILKKVLNEELQIVSRNKYSKGFTPSNQPMQINKSNPKRVYVHYLPWFQSKNHDGFWGQHWTMANKNPDNLDENGLNDVASYYNPLIGPYSSSDKHLQEYHFLLMKLSGVDGVIFDWYGCRDIHDFGVIKHATETFIPVLEDVGLEFSIMYEDRVAYLETDNIFNDPVNRAKQDFEYIKNVYFKSNNYMSFNDFKIISIFGPHHINNATDWNTIYNVFDETDQPAFISLWALSNNLGNAFKGEFLWVAQDHLLAQDYYYNTYANNNTITIGSTYPGFHSFYSDGGWINGANSWVLPKYDGLTFIESLNNSSLESADVIQIVTWNDFGEGTMIEPTHQFGFKYLSMLQEYTGSTHNENDLIVATKLYQTRKKYVSNTTVQGILDNSYIYMKELKINRVEQILQAIERFEHEL